ncbi:unannotated protein [freshwater metagenome]|uniref:Unannotated protein n=1 Tax=freshwater metagenome TaxID=449393 RepID=A0A6J7I4K5_9ZZZZ|nr:choice-of-anchor D domain-containing protein [Actinomycetota bacterium]
MSVTRLSAVAAPLPDGSVLVAGGWSGSIGSFTANDSADIFDPVSEQFTPAPNPMTVARVGAVAAPLPDGRVLIAGGLNGSSQILSSAEVFNPATQTFTAISGMNSPRYQAAAATLADGRVLIVGGGNGPSIASAEIFDPVTNTFSWTTSYSDVVQDAAAAPLLDGRVLIAGGLIATSPTGFAAWFNPLDATYKAIDPMAQTRWGASATTLLDGRVLIAGGVVDSYIEGSSVLFDQDQPLGPFGGPLSGSFFTSPKSAMARTRYRAVSALLPNGTVLIAGGASNTNGPARDSAEIFTPGPVARISGGTFGDQEVGRSLVQLVRVRNLGGQFPLRFSSGASVTVSSDFSIVADGCRGKTLEFQQDCDLEVRFTPSTTGTREALLTLSTNTAGTNVFTLSGTGDATGAGPKGDKGDKGDTGLQGSQGVKGAAGRDATVKCKVSYAKATKKTKVTCTVSRAKSASARLSRSGRTVARARVSRSGRVTLSGRLTRGTYRVSVGTAYVTIRVR